MSAGPRDEHDVPDLVRRAQAGDHAAFELLARRFYDRIFRWALTVTGDADDAEDATQEVLIRVHRGIRSFAGRAAFTTWLYRVTRNAAVEIARRRERARTRSVRGPDPRPEQELEMRVQTIDRARATKLVREFFATLPARQREVFDLVDVQGWTPREVAGMLKMKPVTVRANLLKARRAIRTKILERHPHLLEE